jgi:hypothetical protein
MQEEPNGNELSELIIESLNEIAEEAESGDGSMGESIDDLYDEIGDAMYEETIETMEESLEDWREELSGFRERLYDDWQDPIDLLEAFIIYSRDSGMELQRDVGDQARENEDLVFLTLLKLHGRAIQVSQEILTLIKQGFADGAHARWRALHEIAVVSMFINQTGEETAKRFLLHELVDDYHLKKQIKEHDGTGFLGEVSGEELEDAEERLNHLCEQFGDGFGGLWGWAAHEIPNPKFRDLENAVNLDHHRPYYDFASKVNVHSGAKGTNAQIGLTNRPYTSASGPTNSGFYLPGFQTAVSLYQVSVALMMHIVIPETPADLRVMDRLLDDIYHAFMKAQEDINKKDEKMIEQIKDELEKNKEEFLEEYEPVDPSEYQVKIDLEQNPD